MAPVRALGLLMTTLYVAWTSAALAETHRFALVIGSDEGMADEERLLYASEDARRMAAVLGELGGVPDDHLVLLENPTAEQLRGELTELRRRVATWPRAEGDELLVMLYYSGHAEPLHLNLGGERFSYRELKDAFQAFGADVGVLILDACYAGEMTRLKGADPAAPFEIDLEGLEGQGLAIITSSSPDEAAQESDQLQGSFFTHHLIAGMRGAADRTGDRRITLDEVYQYAYDETVRSSSRARFVQHPAFSFELHGRRHVVLTHLALAHAEASRVVFGEPGAYVFFKDDAQGPLVAEVHVEAGAEIILEAGDYAVRHLDGERVFERSLQLASGSSVQLSVDQMTPLSPSQVLRKGVYDDTNVAVAALGGVAGAVVPRTSLLALGALGLEYEGGSWLFAGRFRYAGATSNADTPSDYHHFGLSAEALLHERLQRFGLGVGLHAGADLVWQRLPGGASSHQLVPRLGATARASYAALPTLEVLLQGGVELLFLDVADEGYVGAWSPFVGLGFAWLLP